MLLNFTVKNFRSIRTEQHLSLLATRHSTLSEALLKSKHVRHGVLPVAAVYGPNAAGKTTLYRALEAFSDAVSYSHRVWAEDADLRFEPHFFATDEETSFEAEFLIDDQPYRYGFSCDRKRFLKEWLFSGKKKLYERLEQTFTFGRAFSGSRQITAYSRPNALFLSTATQNNHALLTPIARWLSKWMTIEEDSQMVQMITTRLLKEDHQKKFLISVLKIIDSQIVDIEIPDKPEKPWPFQVTDPRLNEAMGEVERWRSLRIKRKAKSGQRSTIDISDESAGTIRYFSLIGPLMFALTLGSVMLIDEADASLHPTLLRAIVQLFHNPKTNPQRAQLIINTHDTTLLSGGALRPDEVFFMEREGEEGSVIYSLADFEHVRGDTSSQKQYLDGRYGALPFLENHIGLFEKEIRREGFA